MPPEPTDSSDIEALQRQIAELQAKLSAAQQVSVSGSGAAARGGGDGEHAVNADGADTLRPVHTGAQTTITTAGGAAVQGSVDAGGHFIGHDFVQIITNVVYAGEDVAEAKSVIAHYLDAFTSDLAGLKLGEIDASAKDTKREPLQLADVYVPLDTELQIPEGATLAQWVAREECAEPVVTDKQPKMRSVSALEALAAHRELTLLGKPGSGKSTFGASVLLTLAQVWQGHGGELAKLGETWTAEHGAPLPIRVVLRRFADQLPPGKKPARAGDLWAFISRDLDASGYGLSPRAAEYVQRIARTHGALILFDGLDECGSSATRERVLNAVDELKRSASHCRFMVTARPYAWPGGPDPSQGVHALADLKDKQIEQFIRAWYAALVARKWLSPGESQRKMEDLLVARNRPDLQPLTGNPLLLTLMATLHANRGRLPDDRADLYNECVDLLLLRWNRQIGADKALLDELGVPGLKLSDLRDVLEELAFRVHDENAAKASADTGPKDSGTADLGEDRLVRAFRPLLNDSRDKAAIVVDYIEKRAGLLIGQGEKAGERQFTFPHRTFQEFLAACHLAARDDFPAECARLARAAPEHWSVVLPLAARLAKVERGASAADELIYGSSIADFRAHRRPEPRDWNCALLAALQLQEIGIGAVKTRERTRAIATRVINWLVASLPVVPAEGGLSARYRANAGDVLAALGDPRFDPERFFLPADDTLGFVRIPADPEFRIGTRQADAQRVKNMFRDELGSLWPSWLWRPWLQARGARALLSNEVNDALTPTPEFYIGRYPVTVAQFRVFFELNQPEDFFERVFFALRGADNAAAVVTWKLARAYCKWLDELLRTSPLLEGTEAARLVREDGWHVTVPSELEWEKAARGGRSDTLFPWGDMPDPECANVAGSKIGRASGVGCFPTNGFGLHDLIGNVWEWTRSVLDAPAPAGGKERVKFGYPYDPDDPRREDLTDSEHNTRVVRGGSFLDPWPFARCASRRGGSLRMLTLSPTGFRIMLRSGGR